MLNYSQLHIRLLNGISQAKERTTDGIELNEHTKFTEQGDATELCD